MINIKLFIIIFSWALLTITILSCSSQKDFYNLNLEGHSSISYNKIGSKIQPSLNSLDNTQIIQNNSAIIRPSPILEDRSKNKKDQLLPGTFASKKENKKPINISFIPDNSKILNHKFLEARHPIPFTKVFQPSRNKAGIPWDDILGWMYGVFMYLILADIIFLIALGLQALFPALPLWAGLVIGASTLFFILVGIVLVYGVH